MGSKVESYDFFGFQAKGVVDDDLPKGKGCEFYIPAIKPFREWDVFGRGGPSASTRKADLGKPADPFYSPEQIFALATLKRSIQILRNNDLKLVKDEVKSLQTHIK